MKQLLFILLLTPLIYPSCDSFSGKNTYCISGLDPDVVGEYRINVFMRGYNELRLHKDGSFSEEYAPRGCVIDDWETYITKGTYCTNSNQLKLFPKTIIIRNSKLDIDTIPYKENVLPSFHDLYTIIKWNKHLYLLDNNEILFEGVVYNAYTELSRNVNSGELFRYGYVRGIFKKRGDFGKPKLEDVDLNQIPEEYKHLFFLEPLRASVIGLEHVGVIEGITRRGYENEINIYTINKGSKDGLYKGLKLYVRDKEMKIVSLRKGASLVEMEYGGELYVYRTDGVKKGDILSTRKNWELADSLFQKYIAKEYYDFK